MLLPPAKPADLEAVARRETRRDLAALEFQGQPAAFALAFGGTVATPAAGTRREVLFAAAAAPDVQRRLQPLVNAGFIVDGVVTPALALMSIARLRRTDAPGGVVGYLAVNAESSALALVRNGLLLFAREIPWGYRTDAEPGRPTVDREKVVARLTSELRRSFLFFKQTMKLQVEQIVTCGDMPDLRSVTAPLITALDLQVETLDSMEGIDLGALPEPAADFRARVAELRLAWAVAADAAPVNLLPREIRAAREASRQRLVIGGGVAAAAVVAGLLYAQAGHAARVTDQRLRQLQQEIATLEPRARAAELARQRVALDQARRATVQALDTQGVRLARALEVLAHATSDEVVLNAIKLQAGGAVWRASVSGLALASDPAQAQAAVSRFFEVVEGSPYLGAPVRPPTLRIATGGRAALARAEEGAAAPGGRPTPSGIPEGMSGIEFSVEFEIRK